MEGSPVEPPSGQQCIVNVHQAKIHLSRLIDAAHGGETILLAKAGKPWARLMPLESADGFSALAITPAHGLRAGAYSQAHRDPFDRLLAAQAEVEQLVLLTADTQQAAFPCQILW
jgi:prevent-host-death family protein